MLQLLHAAPTELGWTQGDIVSTDMALLTYLALPYCVTIGVAGPPSDGDLWLALGSAVVIADRFPLSD